MITALRCAASLKHPFFYSAKICVTTDPYVSIQEASVRMGFVGLNTGLLARNHYVSEGPATAQAKGDRSQVLSSYPILLMQPPRLDSSLKLHPCLLTTELYSPVTYFKVHQKTSLTLHLQRLCIITSVFILYYQKEKRKQAELAWW